MENFVILRKNPDYVDESEKKKKKWRKAIGMERAVMGSNEVKIAKTHSRITNNL